jgi:hypothetical protein
MTAAGYVAWIGRSTHSSASYLSLGSADGYRPPKLEHAVQRTNGDRDLRLATPVRSRAQPIPDHLFEAADGSLHQRSPIIPGPLLPTHPPVLGDALEMPVALGRSSLSVSLSTTVDRGGTITSASG